MFSAILCTCQFNLAETAHKVISNGAKAADCKQRRKCLEMDEGRIVLPTQMLSLGVSKSELDVFYQKGFELERRRMFTSLHKVQEICKCLITLASDLASGQWVHEPFKVFELNKFALR
jgi:hypothetical protein